MDTKESTLKRPRRTPVDGARDILTVLNKDPNYVYRWVADDPRRPGRIERLKERGYEVVAEKHEVGQKTVDKVSQLGQFNTVAGGGGITLVLMRQLREWYDEDQKTKQDKVNALEEAMKADVRQGRIPGSREPGFGNLDITRK